MRSITCLGSSQAKEKQKKFAKGIVHCHMRTNLTGGRKTNPKLMRTFLLATNALRRLRRSRRHQRPQLS
jgi:hypothetical protein